MLNLKYIKEISDDDELAVKEILDLFFQTMEQDIHLLIIATSSWQYHKMMHIIHKIRGSLMLVGAHAFLNVLDDFENKIQIFQDCNAELQSLCQYYRKLCTNYSYSQPLAF